MASEITVCTVSGTENTAVQSDKQETAENQLVIGQVEAKIRQSYNLEHPKVVKILLKAFFCLIVVRAFLMLHPKISEEMKSKFGNYQTDQTFGKEMRIEYVWQACYSIQYILYMEGMRSEVVARFLADVHRFLKEPKFKQYVSRMRKIVDVISASTVAVTCLFELVSVSIMIRSSYKQEGFCCLRYIVSAILTITWNIIAVRAWLAAAFCLMVACHVQVCMVQEVAKDLDEELSKDVVLFGRTSTCLHEIMIKFSNVWNRVSRYDRLFSKFLFCVYYLSPPTAASAIYIISSPRIYQSLPLLLIAIFSASIQIFCMMMIYWEAGRVHTQISRLFKLMISLLIRYGRNYPISDRIVLQRTVKKISSNQFPICMTCGSIIPLTSTTILEFAAGATQLSVLVLSSSLLDSEVFK